MKIFLKYTSILAVNLLIFIILLKIIDPFFEEESEDVNFFERHLILNEYAAHSDFELTPSDHIMSEVDNLEKKAYRLRTDSKGFIIGPDDIDHPVDPVNIIFFGGSTTECFFVDEDKRFPYLAGKILTNNLGERISVKNAGLMGKNSMKSNFDLMIRGKQSEPDLVVLMHNINDLVQLLYVNSYFDGPETRRVVADQIEVANPRGPLYRFLFSIKEWVFPNIYERIKESFLNTDQNSGEVDEWSMWREDREFYFNSLIDEYKKSLKTFISISKSNGYEPILMTQFNRMDANDEFIVNNYYNNVRYGIPHDLFFEYYHLFNDAIRQTARQENVLLIDLANRIPSTSEYLYDAVHLNTTGSVLTAQIIAEEIEQRFYKLINTDK